MVEVPQRAWLSHTLTRICYVAYIKEMESVFEIIAEPNCMRDIEPPDLVTTIGGRDRAPARMTQPTVSKHLRVLREAGFVESTVDAQRRLYRLKPEPFQEVDAWLAQFRRFWSAHIDALERHLDRMDPSTSMKKEDRQRMMTDREQYYHRVRPAGRRYEGTWDKAVKTSGR